MSTMPATSSCIRCRRPYTPLRRDLCKSCYVRTRKRETAYGRWQPDRVDAEPSRAHVLALKAAGVRLRRIPVLAGVSRSTITTLLYGKPGRPPAVWISRATADKIRAVPIPDTTLAVIVAAAPHDLVSALGAQRRLRALMADSWPIARLARDLDDGSCAQSLYAIVRGITTEITVQRHRDIADLFARRQMTPGPSSRASNYARKHRWARSLQWDEHDLDDPDGVPAPRSRRYDRARAGEAGAA